MLNPVDLSKVIRPDSVSGRDPDEIHKAVAWWVGSCLVLTAKVHGVVLVDDGTELAKAYSALFAQGAINCRSYAATVSVLGEGDEDLLAYGVRTFQVPGARISSAGDQVVIRLLAADGTVIGIGSGLEKISDLIARDKVPLPVNDRARGHIVYRLDLATHYAAAKG
ncbi:MULTISPECIES: hypothetical protein [Kitasatospora]|uniref:Uncharacterized protein n=1 Tax=Kitasatospora setae (strain ATCC 33774 / DSM 43861 / JCM 3304 / KCC A-0304 / NBRC 14216 / KM-6054) TaxID=452652 RepID=E4NG34_KITSK|nr:MULTISPECIES: hypothetical protein [Kitasatospora]BAJ30464.1 hypothetical protein KSE_46830 [Kitasatospora setae KM-6054]